MPLNSFQGADFIWTISVPCPILFNMNASVRLLPYSSSQIIEKSCCPHLVLVQFECNCTCAYFLLCAIIDIQHLHWCLDWIKYYKIKIISYIYIPPSQSTPANSHHHHPPLILSLRFITNSGLYVTIHHLQGSKSKPLTIISECVIYEDSLSTIYAITVCLENSTVIQFH